MKQFLKMLKMTVSTGSFVLFTILTAFAFGANAEIRELSTFSAGSVESEADEQTWVIFDIDNTLLHPTTMIGSHQWGDYMHAQRLALGGSEAEASAFQHGAFGAVQEAVPVALTEPAALGAIEQLKARGVKVFALTARSESIYPTTLKQLAKIGIDLRDAAPKLDAHVHDGVVFANGEAKGALLKRLVQSSAVKPSKIVFADDKRYNLESLELSLGEAGVPFVGFRYGFLDKEVAGFRGDIANTEWVEFKRTGQILSDSDAAQLIFSK